MEFITGNNFKEYCDFILDEHGFRQQTIEYKKSQTPVFFVKTDYIEFFFSSALLPKENFILLTHNGDLEINSKHIKYLNYTFLQKWYAQNVNIIHEKLIPIPIGIANPQWPHGDISVLNSVIQSNPKRDRLMYANFSINTNYKQRSYCLKFISSKYIENNVSFQTYLTHIAQSYFNICPLGNGIDSHRIWESLYLRTVPIVEDTYNIRYLQRSFNLPIILVNDWNKLMNLDLSDTLYNEVIGNFDSSILIVENFISL